MHNQSINRWTREREMAEFGYTCKFQSSNLRLKQRLRVLSFVCVCDSLCVFDLDPIDVYIRVE